MNRGPFGLPANATTLYGNGLVRHQKETVTACIEPDSPSRVLPFGDNRWLTVVETADVHDGPRFSGLPASCLAAIRSSPPSGGIVEPAPRKKFHAKIAVPDTLRLPNSCWRPPVAEREGFEPSRRLPAYTRSRRAPSTTRPPLQNQHPAIWPLTVSRIVGGARKRTTSRAPSTTRPFPCQRPHAVCTGSAARTQGNARKRAFSPCALNAPCRWCGTGTWAITQSRHTFKRLARPELYQPS